VVSGVVSASILLVIGDDEERLHLRRALAGEGWRVIPAGTGAQARQMADRQTFEVAVVDNRLPDERGFRLSAPSGPYRLNGGSLAGRGHDGPHRGHRAWRRTTICALRSTLENWWRA
jgi:hypothetical protein